MEFPYGLSPRLNHYTNQDSEEAFFDELSKNNSDFLLFFDEACDNETWIVSHEELTRKMLEWLTQRFLEDKLNLKEAKDIRQKINKHIHIFRSLIPYNLSFKVEDVVFKENSLLFASASEYFHQLIQVKYHEDNLKIKLKDITLKSFRYIEEYINTGAVSNLWREDHSDIYDLLEISTEWDLPGLMQECEDIYKRYINEDNALDVLIKSQGKPWFYIKKICIEKIHLKRLDIEVTQYSQNELTVEFIKFTDRALDSFHVLKEYVAKVVCGKDLINERVFGGILQQHSIKALDVSGTRDFSEQLTYISSTLEELDLSRCNWVNDANLKKMLLLCPRIRKLALSSDGQISFLGWGELSKLSYLDDLDISRCTQINDNDLKIILKACSKLEHFSLEDCTNITERGFLDLPKSLPYLISLNLGNCQINDGTISDLGTFCHSLENLNISRCQGISTKGVATLIKKARRLKQLNLQRCSVDEQILREVAQTKSLHIIF